MEKNDEIPDVKIRNVRLDVIEVHLEDENVIDFSPKFTILASELIPLFLVLCKKMAEKYPHGCKFLAEDVLRQVKQECEDERVIQGILDLVDLEKKDS